MGFSIEKINESEIRVQRQKLGIRKTRLNQFIPVGVHQSEISDLKKWHDLTKSQFSATPCKINIQYYLAKNLNILPLKLYNNA